MREEKQFLLDEIEDQLNKFPAFVVTDYAGLAANDAAKMRFQLKKLGAVLSVVRKRVFLKALSKLNVSIPFETLKGHVGVVFAQAEAMETFKFLCQFSKESGCPSILSGRFENKIIDEKTVRLLASLPSLDEMRSQFLGTLEAPMAQTLAVLEALIVRDSEGSSNQSEEQSTQSEESAT